MNIRWTGPGVVLLALTQTGCVVGGYSSRTGWSVWPGGLGLVLIIVVVLYMLGVFRR